MVPQTRQQTSKRGQRAARGFASGVTGPRGGGVASSVSGATSSRGGGTTRAAAAGVGKARGRGRGRGSGSAGGGGGGGRGAAQAPAPPKPAAPPGPGKKRSASPSPPGGGDGDGSSPKRPPKRQRSQSPSDDLRDARKKVWLDDLESIRRERPLCKAKSEYKVNFKGPPPQKKGANVQKGGNAQVISLDSGSDDEKAQATNDDGGEEKINGVKITLIRNYFGLQGSTARRTKELLKYQEAYNTDGLYPSPGYGLRFSIAKLWKDQGWPEVTDQMIDDQHRAQGFVNVLPQPLEPALTKYWFPSGRADLASGFPMVEDTVFAVQPNLAGEASNCFFKAVAYHVYGDHSYHRRVKAEHLHHLHTILQEPNHPRHELYRRLNERFYTTVIGGGTGEIKARRTVANLYQMLTIPKMYTALDMFDITADLYNLFIVVYTLGGKRDVTGVTTMGSYNARHVFITHVDGNHFKPMVPNEYYASEFQLPRITYKSTLGYPMTSKKDEGKHALQHTWRDRWRGALDRREGALPVDHMFYIERLGNVMKGTQAAS